MSQFFNSNHMQWLSFEKTIISNEGMDIKIYKLNHTDDSYILSDWAKHFRNHYCDDSEIDDLREGPMLSKKNYLNEYKFPSKVESPGPSTRSGDFGEILLLDYLEYIQDYWVPRTRFSYRENKNSPTQGIDVLGLKILDIDTESLEDELIIYEVKAKLTTNREDESKKRLEIAIEHSNKDFEKRSGESLNAYVQRFRMMRQNDNVKKIKRFQNPTDRPYIEKSGAAAIILSDSIDDTYIKQVVSSTHKNVNNLELLIISGNDLMNLVHSLYKRAADEA